jgi:prolyl-tRNA editing enzyme YbaK/EbsC (Cys-tRNA(Pro) deacylase)
MQYQETDSVPRQDLTPYLVSPERHALHLPEDVLKALPTGVTVFTVPDDASDTAAFSARFGFDLVDCANTIVLRYRQDGVDRYAGVVSLGSRRLDVNGAVRAHLGAKKVSFADRETATTLTGMEFGGITAFGLPADWRVLVDAAVMEREEVVMGAGFRAAKLLLPPGTLRVLPTVEVAELTLRQ